MEYVTVFKVSILKKANVILFIRCLGPKNYLLVVSNESIADPVIKEEAHIRGETEINIFSLKFF